MAIAAGTRLGPYEVQSPLGTGGMGEVYKARDTRLDRTVAIKVLREHLAHDSDRRARFEREALAISQLNHPHICTLYDVGHDNGLDYLVVEHLDGQTLAERLQKGALPVGQALTIAIQIADALDAAHRAGIVHRDLKPANVMLTKNGAKLLDFGIARMTTVAAAGDLTRAAPAGALTVEGTLLGTVPYMAPEQLEGRDADARTDIFAFGALVYEMLTGRRAFPGESQASVIAAVLTSTPAALADVQPSVLGGLVPLIDGCLAKEPDARWQSAADVRRQLEWLAQAGTQRAPASAARSAPSRERIAWITALALAGIVAAGAWVWTPRTPPGEAAEMRVDLVTPADADPTAFALSPDGRNLVFRVQTGSDYALGLRPLDAESARIVPGTEGGLWPFWSPDSRAVGFFANGKLKRLDIASGSVQTLADAPSQSSGGTWNAAGVIVFGGIGGTLQRINASGGPPTDVTARDAVGGQVFPEFLPDGRHLLFYHYGSPQTEGIYATSLDSTAVTRMFPSNSRPVFLPPDRVIVSRDGALFAQRLDLAAMTPLGEPVPIAPHAVTRPSFTFGAVAASASSTGLVAYRAADEERQFVWLDRAGRRVGTLGAPDLAQPRLARMSPDGHMLAFTRTVAGNADIWLMDTERSTLRRLTTDPGAETLPIWSPDGRRLVYISSRTGIYDVYEQPVDDSEPAKVLLNSPSSKNCFDWSSDGRYIIYAVFAEGGRDLWVLPMSGDRKPFPVVQSPFEENAARFSPDGRWIAYQSNESGRTEVYVQPFPGVGGKVQVSIDGGAAPQYRGDGREIFFRGRGDRLMAASLSFVGATVRIGAPQELFSMPPGVDTEVIAAPDGQRFLSKAVTKDAAPITLLFNWKPSAPHATP